MLLPLDFKRGRRFVLQRKEEMWERGREENLRSNLWEKEGRKLTSKQAKSGSRDEGEFSGEREREREMNRNQEKSRLRSILFQIAISFKSILPQNSRAWLCSRTKCFQLFKNCIKYLGCHFTFTVYVKHFWCVAQNTRVCRRNKCCPLPLLLIVQQSCVGCLVRVSSLKNPAGILPLSLSLSFTFTLSLFHSSDGCLALSLFGFSLDFYVEAKVRDEELFWMCSLFSLTHIECVCTSV